MVNEQHIDHMKYIHTNCLIMFKVLVEHNFETSIKWLFFIRSL